MIYIDDLKPSCICIMHKFMDDTTHTEVMIKASDSTDNNMALH